MDLSLNPLQVHLNLLKVLSLSNLPTHRWLQPQALRVHSYATKQLTIAAAVEWAIKYKPGSLRKRRIGACILKLVITDLQPLTVVENRSFRELLRSTSSSSDSGSST